MPSIYPAYISEAQYYANRETLRANLQKRKAQARSRRSGEADQRPEGISAAKEKTGG